MDIQRLRNLTTHRLHTEMEHIYQDLEWITGIEGIFTHMLPNVMMAVDPWLKTKVTDERFYDGKFDTTHTGEYPIEPMTPEESQACLQRFGELPSLLLGKQVIAVVTP